MSSARVSRSPAARAAPLARAMGCWYNRNISIPGGTVGSNSAPVALQRRRHGLQRRGQHRPAAGCAADPTSTRRRDQRDHRRRQRLHRQHRPDRRIVRRARSTHQALHPTEARGQDRGHQYLPGQRQGRHLRAGERRHAAARRRGRAPGAHVRRSDRRHDRRAQDPRQHARSPGRACSRTCGCGWSTSCAWRSRGWAR